MIDLIDFNPSENDWNQVTIDSDSEYSNQTKKLWVSLLNKHTGCQGKTTLFVWRLMCNEIISSKKLSESTGLVWGKVNIAFCLFVWLE